ncbi:MAG: SGNH/GDSL hydrolase family protein [Bacilli bacterium]|nr:SGNH/GDSL hydrolase family protein [Bacilli bacterium]
MGNNWTFEQRKNDFKDKRFVVFGDSVSANETYQNNGKTYCHLLCNYLGAEYVKDYAIGGTTVTYMYPGSNIEKEYKDHKVAIDGVRVLKRAKEAGELDNIDVAFIAFGHNDQYFQPPLDKEGDDGSSLDKAHSFKGSFRYMVKELRKVNPNIEIVILNCTYSEYDLNSKEWDRVYYYDDYRKATAEVAKELNCKLIDPWEATKPYFDGKTAKVYYHDDVHLSQEGHKIIFNYVLNH